METDSKGKTPSQETKTADNTEKSKSKPKQKTEPNSSKSTPTQTLKTSDSGASNQSQDLPPPTKQNSPQATEINKNDPQTATKPKLQTNSPKVERKKTKDTSATNKDSTNQEHTVVINGKACVQRNLRQQQSKIPVSKQVRTGRTPSNRGTGLETRPRQQLLSRHREAGSVEGRGKIHANFKL